MMAELVLGLCLSQSLCTQPVHIRGVGKGNMNSLVGLNLSQDITDDIYARFNGQLWLDDNTPGRIMGSLELMYRLTPQIDLGFYHQSKHNLDVGYGDGIEIDMMMTKIRLK